MLFVTLVTFPVVELIKMKLKQLQTRAFKVNIVLERDRGVYTLYDNDRFVEDEAGNLHEALQIIQEKEKELKEINR